MMTKAELQNNNNNNGKKKKQQLGHTSMEWVDNAATWNNSESPDWQTETY